MCVPDIVRRSRQVRVRVKRGFAFITEYGVLGVQRLVVTPAPGPLTRVQNRPARVQSKALLLISPYKCIIELFIVH